MKKHNAVRNGQADRSGRPLVIIFGLRGMEGVQGGVETHVTQLVQHLPIPAARIEVLGRKPYRPQGLVPNPALPRIRWLPTTRYPALEALFHSILAVGYAAVRRPAMLHIHGIGPNLVTPLARLLGLRVVATHHGNDYDREKWGGFARAMLRRGERNAVLHANATISISPIVAEALRERYKRDVTYIPNGVRPTAPVPAGETLARFELVPGRYIVNVARLVPEKRQSDLIEAFGSADLPDDVRLVLIGGADHDADYVHRVRALAAADRRVILAGHVSGAPLAELFSNAGLFVLPSTHEGLPIALLEAMTYGLPLLLSDLPVYLAMALPAACLFPVGNVAALSRQLGACFAAPAGRVNWGSLLTFYDWEHVGRETMRIYDRVLGLE